MIHRIKDLGVLIRIGVHLTDAFKDKFQRKRPGGAKHHIEDEFQEFWKHGKQCHKVHGQDCVDWQANNQDQQRPAAAGFEQLTCKDKVATLHGHFMSIKAVCNRGIACSELLDNPNLRPVVVSQGALGRGLPKRNLRVSKQHRFLVSSPICRRMFGTDATLVSAIQLTQLPGIFIDRRHAGLRIGGSGQVIQPLAI